jgi:hypothetical protein
MKKFSLVSLAVFSPLGCGGSDSAPEAAKTPMTGVFLDGAVENLDYVAGTAAKPAPMPRANSPATPAIP